MTQVGDVVSSAKLIERCPSVDEYSRLMAVGWKPRDAMAIRAALDRSDYAVCVEIDGHSVGIGRVIGDGGLHYYLTDIVVMPQHQRRGIGSRIVGALTRFVESVPFENTWLGVFAADGTAEFYARFGYKAQRATGPAMFRWLNPSDA